MPRRQAENTEKKNQKEKGYEPEGKSWFDRGRFIGYVNIFCQSGCLFW